MALGSRTLVTYAEPNIRTLADIAAQALYSPSKPSTRATQSILVYLVRPPAADLTTCNALTAAHDRLRYAFWEPPSALQLLLRPLQQ